MAKAKVKFIVDLECVSFSDVNICETAGFVDLETRFKRLEQSGYVANFFRDQFDTEDIREIFLGDDTTIYAEDDEDTVRKKLILQDRKRAEILKSKLGNLAVADDDSDASRAGGSSESKLPSQSSETKDDEKTSEVV